MEKKRIAIIRLSSLGDVVLSTVTVKILSDFSEIAFITKSEFKEILSGLKVKVYDVKNSSFPELIKVSFKVKMEFSPEFVLDLHDKIPSMLIRKILDTGGKKTVVWDAQRKERRMGIITHDFRNVKHTAERFKEAAEKLLKKMGVIKDKNEVFPELCKPEKPDNMEIFKFVKGAVLNSRKIITIAPEAKKRTRMWDIKEVKKLVEDLRDEFEVITISKSEHIASEIGEKFFSGTTLKDILYIVGNSSVVVAMDSAITHISMALKIPTVTVFTSSTPDMGFSPYGNAISRIVEPENLRCRPCSLYGRDTCPYSHFLCTKIDYRKVKDKILEIVDILEKKKKKEELEKAE